MQANRLGRACLVLMLIPDARVGLARTKERKPKRASVVVYVVKGDFAVGALGRAEQTATRIFATIGVPIVFRSGAKRNSGEEAAVGMEMQLDGWVPTDFHPGSLAYATPFADSGTRIHVLCERASSHALDRGTGAVLGHVMAHEIAHVLEGTDRHSTEGVMKARWKNVDFQQMVTGSLSFDPTDADLIRTALEQRVTRLPSGEPQVR